MVGGKLAASSWQLARGKGRKRQEARSKGRKRKGEVGSWPLTVGKRKEAMITDWGGCQNLLDLLQSIITRPAGIHCSCEDVKNLKIDY